MNAEKRFSTEILEQLEKGQSVVLLSVVGLEGSSPRHPGSKMYISRDGIGHGTIGGSLLEARSVEEGKRALAGKQSKFLDFDLALGSKDSIGMICGGKAVVLVDYIPPTTENINLFKRWDDAVAAGDNFLFITRVRELGQTAGTSAHMLLFNSGKTVGEPLYPGLFEPRHNSPDIIAVEDGRIVIDPIKKLNTLYCFGGGHVAVPTVHIAALVGFRTVVIDDRAEFANSERFPDAEQVFVKDYDGALKELEINEDSLVIIMTRGHSFDRIVLEQALKTPAYYIGMISSNSKRDTVYKALLAKGFTQADLDCVHSPIGIAIGSETPEEIAVSIAAELIEVRASRAK